MEELLLHIIRCLREDPHFDARKLVHVIHTHSDRLPGDQRFAKRQLMPYYLHVKSEDRSRWESWGIDPETERRLLRLIQMKPRRTASGVATITVITKPHTCRGACLFCPNDVRMPKSYLHDEPACQRAERSWFDPYLQVSSRLRTLGQMGHATDKVELIVLGGTWSDYPEAYQRWFMRELFRALNDAGDPALSQAQADERAARYRAGGIEHDPGTLEQATRDVQDAVEAGSLPFNAAIRRLYGPGTAWEAVSRWQLAEPDEVEFEQKRNETARHRCVGLVVETRPDLVTAASLMALRRYGCTKVQIGVQTLNPSILERCNRHTDAQVIRDAFSLLRLFGFKIHAHFMVNLPGATPEADKRDFAEFAQGAPYQPDEVKLYPCALVRGAALQSLLDEGSWRPYPEGELVDVLVHDVLACPPYIRISRMIRDFSSHDIVAGNKKTNLRQLVEGALDQTGETVHEMRFREIGTQGARVGELAFERIDYHTETTEERFLQWVTPEGKLAGFLRLSLPHQDALAPGLPIRPGEAMIREVHVYGKVARLHGTGEGAQHLGLGRRLVDAACTIAHGEGYRAVNVISAVGTREYYRRLGFADNGLYQQKQLT